MGISQPKFWAEQVAERAIEEAKRRGFGVVTCRSGQTPSGAKHIGNFNDNIRSYFVARFVEKLGYKARHVQTHDDMDPLRKVPTRVVDLDGKWHELSEEELRRLSSYVGFPLVSVPDPFGCCDSWATHFERVWEEGCEMAGIRKTEYYRNVDLYKKGKFDEFIERVFRRIEIVRDILMKYKSTKTPEYYPFWVICENCGRLTGKVYEVDLDSRTVYYRCTSRALAGKYTIPSCDHRGSVGWGGGSGKLDWQLEWPSQMVMFQTVVEPFGKDHYVGSWPICREVLPKVFGYQPILTFVYEFFLVDGKKMSTRHGNVYIMHDMLSIMEPEVFCYLYTKRPTRQRDISLTQLSLVDEFDRVERIYFGLERAKNEREEREMRTRYELSWCDREIPRNKPFRLPYSIAALLAQLVKDPEKEVEKAVHLLRRIGYLRGELDDNSRKSLVMRLRLAKEWIKRFAPPEMKFEVLKEVPREISSKLTEHQRAALREVAQILEQREFSVEELHAELYNIAKKYGLSSPEFFSSAYLILLGKDHGPRLAPFLLALDREFVIKRFRLEG